MRQSGFTLLELSIVIVIIGLIVAGVSAGQSLVRQANLRSILSDASTYKAAYNTFRLQYDAIPGDMANASDYWPTTPNGDGNGIAQCFVGTYEESPLFFLHLANAGIIEGSFSGNVTHCNNYSSPRPTIGVDYPAAPFQNTVYDFISSVDNLYSTIREGNFLGFYRIKYDTPNYSWMGAITSAEAYALDTKNDDGIADQGQTVARASRSEWSDIGNNAVCTTSVYNTPTRTASDYDFSDQDESCAMGFSLE